MSIKYIKQSGEGIDKSRFSEKMRVLEGKYSEGNKVRADIKCLNYLKRELIEKTLVFNDRVSV